MDFLKKVMFRMELDRPEVFLEKGVLKICSKFTGEHRCRSVISIKLLCNLIEIALLHGRSLVNLLHIFRTPFLKNTSGWLLLNPLSHDLVIGNLHAYGFQHDALELLHSFLSKIWYRTKVNTSFSSWEELIKGVPQGSDLVPLLFNLYLNDLF